MQEMQRTRTRRRSVVAIAVASAIALVGCAEQDSGGGSSAEGSAGGSSTDSGSAAGLEVGASKEDFQAALANDPQVTLRTQTTAPKGSVTGLPMEKYFAAVEDWSGGKISFDIQYANAIAPPADADDALLDGRLDIASVLPIYDPSAYPANNALIGTGFISDQSAVRGALASNAWPNQVAFANADIMKEFDDHGIVPLIPVYNSGANGLFCSEKRDSAETIKGTTIGVGGKAGSAQVEALGASPTSVPYTEFFESLQRGVIDCTVTSPTVSVLGGFTAEAPHVVIDPEAGFALAPGTLGISKTSWEGLSLAARQLMWDRLDVFVGANITEKIFVNDVEMAKVVKASGGQITPFSEDARSALQAANAKLLDELRTTKDISDPSAFVDSAEAANKEWNEKVASMNFPDVSYDEIDTWFTSPDAVDISAYTAEVMKSLNDYRPSS